MIELTEVKQYIKNNVTEVKFKIPSQSDIKSLKLLNIPEYFIDFISDFEPPERIFVGSIRMLPIVEILDENKEYVPGADVYQLGFTVFASTVTGDAICFDMNGKNQFGEHDIYLISHDISYEGESINYLRTNSDFIANSFIKLLSEIIWIEDDED